MTTTGYPSPLELPQFWSVCALGDFAVPPDAYEGSVKVTVKPSQKVDQKPAAGKNKAATTTQGLNAAEVTVDLIFTPKSWPLVELVIRGLWPPKKPVAIVHPNAELHGIAAVTIKSVSGVSWDEQMRGHYTWTCEEWSGLQLEAGSTLLLRRGSSGPEVLRWQRFLSTPRSAMKVQPPPVDFPGSDTLPQDGFFGEATDTATREFQAEEGAKVDGIVGPETFGKASRYGYQPPPPLKGGSVTNTPKQSTPANPGGPVDAVFGTTGVGGFFGGAVKDATAAAAAQQAIQGAGKP